MTQETLDKPLPLNKDQFDQLLQFSSELDQSQKIWVSGFFAGLAANTAVGKARAGQNGHAQIKNSGNQETKTITVLFGSQTGNAKSVAQKLAGILSKQPGAAIQLKSMADYKPTALKKESVLLIIVSTHGEGDPPDSARSLHSFLYSNKAPKLTNLQYAVLALGDSGYEFFCKTGRDFDERLEELGAERLFERIDADVDFDEPADKFIEKAQSFTSLVNGSAESGITVQGSQSAPVTAAAAPVTYDRNRPYKAEILTNQRITGRRSEKDVRHIELSVEDSGLHFRPGDSLAVYCENDPELVNLVLSAAGFTGKEIVQSGSSEKSLKDALVYDFEITRSYAGFVKAWTLAIGDTDFASKTADREFLRDYLSQRQILDIIREHPGSVNEHEFVKALRKLQPRLYSIASSPAEFEDEIHLTVKAERAFRFERIQEGAASSYLARSIPGSHVSVFVAENERFRLPGDDVPVIMAGPGTGIAPFRAFLQERSARGASGKNWLFFGNGHFNSEFLYQSELLTWRKDGLLNKLTVAFSRDQKDRIYIQHKIEEQGAEIFSWLEAGAHFYICGAISAGAAVESSLEKVIRKHGGLKKEQSAEYITRLREEKRLHKDVY